MTHNARVLALLSDGEPHSHHELYQLHVVAHSRVSALRKQGHVIHRWLEDGAHWYQLQDSGGGPSGLAPLLPREAAGTTLVVRQDAVVSSPLEPVQLTFAVALAGPGVKVW